MSGTRPLRTRSCFLLNMASLITQSVPKTIMNLAVPMLAGTFAIQVYNLTTTWLVSRLGTDSLAAMSFSFPVVMLVGFALMSIGTGTMTVVAYSLGGGNHAKAARVTSHSVLLMLLMSGLLCIAGFATAEPLFRRLGADGNVLQLTCDYMRIFYLGMGVQCLQNMFLNIITCTGNTKVSSALMVAGTGLNLAVSPFLIFGLYGFPRMEIKGAALATIIAQSVILALSFRILRRKHHLLNADVKSRRRILISWRRVLNMGLPAVYSSVLTPVCLGINTKLAAGFGTEVVAALGVTGRLEMFSCLIPMSIGMTLTPFVAQNYGAGRLDRIRQGKNLAMSFAIIYGLCMAVMFYIFTPSIAPFFSQDQEVIRIIIKYVYITCACYGCLEVFRYCTFVMNGMQRPLFSAGLNTIRIVLLLIPGFIIGAHFWGVTGLISARTVCDAAACIFGVLIVNRVIDKAENSHGTIIQPELRDRHPMHEQRRRDYPETN